MAKKKKGADAEAESPSFEASLEALEAIVRRLDAEALGIEEAMTEYEKGLEALKRCRRILDEAERKLEVLVKAGEGKAETRPFRPEGESGNATESPRKAGKPRRKAGEEAGENSREGFLF